MLKRDFSSKITMDKIEISYFKKSHKSDFKIKTIDDVYENIKLIGLMIEYSRQNDIKWICVNLTNEPKIPENTVWFKHEQTGNICCHIEDFEKFYIENMCDIIKRANIYYEQSKKQERVDGWIVVKHRKNGKKIKLNKLLNDIKTLTSDWSVL